MRDPVRDTAQFVIQPVGVRLVKIMQDIACHSILMAGMADTHAHAIIIGTDMRMDGPQPVVARVTTPCFNPDLTWCKVQFIMEHDHFGGVDFMKPRSFTHGLT